MFTKFLSLAAFLTLTSFALAQVVINEVDSDTPGTDKAEFVELFGTPNTSLDGWLIVTYNGNGSVVVRSYSLAELSTDANGIFLAGQPGVDGVPGMSERIAAGTGIELLSGSLQNGEEGVALYQGRDIADFPEGAAVSTTGLIDAAVFRSGFGDSGSELLTDLGVTGSAADEAGGTVATSVASVGRFPDGGTPLDMTNWQTYDTPSPGALNTPAAELNLSFTATNVAENAGGDGTIIATLSQDGDADLPLTVTITNSDPSELAMPAEVIIPGDGSGETTFLITPLDDGAADGTITVAITATAPGFFDGEGTIDVTDDGDAPTLVINEVNAEVEEGRDANGNGLTDHQGDEFVELVNVSGATLDISGWSLSDDDGLSHVFPAATVLDPGCAVVVFGGGIPAEGILGQFGNALVQNASTGALNLNNTGDSLFVRDPGAVERAGFAYGDIDGMDGSQTRDPDLTGPFVGHLTATGVVPFSPGTTAADTPFCTVADSLSLTITGDDLFAEDDGAAASTAEVTRTGDTSAPLEITLSVSDASELAAPATVTIPAGLSSFSFPIDAVDDPFADGDQDVTLAATAGPGYVSASTEVTVADAGGDALNILINEVEVDSPGSDLAEFIELYDGGIGNTPLDGYAVVLFNGTNGNASDDTAYRQFDLDGFSTNAEGFFVIGSIGVPNAGLDVFPIPGGWIINSGTRAIALYSADAADHLNGSAPTDESIIDAVIYGDDTEAANLVAAFGTPAAVPSKDGENDTLSRLPDGSGGQLEFEDFGDGAPTPGAANSALGGTSPYQLWAAGFPGIGAPGDDDESDTLPNAIEFGLGLDPFASDTAALPSPFVNGGGNLQLTVPKGPDAGAAAFFAAVSFDGENWSDTDLNILTDDAATFAVEYTGDAPTALMRWGVNVVP